MKADEPTRGLPAAPFIWGALGLAITHLLLVLITGEAAQPGALRFSRALVSCLLLVVPGFPLALLLLGRTARRDSQGEVGVFALGALSFGLSMILLYILSVLVRAIQPPVTGAQMSLLALASAGLAVLFKARLARGIRVAAEAGLGKGPVLLALILMVATAGVGWNKLFAGVDRFIVLDNEKRSWAMEAEHDATATPLSFVAGVKPRGLRHVMTGDAATLKLDNGGDKALPARLVVGVFAEVGSKVELWGVPGARCGLTGGPGGEPERFASAEVPSEVDSVDISRVSPRWHGLLMAAPSVPVGGACFQVRLLTPQPPALGPAELLDLSGQDFGGWNLFGDRMIWTAPGTAECHLSDAWYRDTMRTSNEISPGLLLWGYFTQFAGELLSGARDPLLGLLFLSLAFGVFCAGLVLIGAAGDRLGPGALGAKAGYLLLGPLASHLKSHIWIDTSSYAFPDATFSFLVLAALALLVNRGRLGFIVLGCMAAYARYPGAYIMAVALLAHLALFKEHRSWSKVTLAWSLAAAGLVVAMLLAHFALTSGVGSFLDAVYMEIFPEHFAVVEDAEPAWIRAGMFLYKLAAFSGLSMLLWPLIRHRAGVLLMLVTVAYTLPLVGVHVAHSHYFPVLFYSTATAGLGAVARREKWWWMVVAGVLSAAGTALGFWGIDW